MKFLTLSLSLIFSFSALAVFNEVECVGRSGRKNVLLEVERFTDRPWTISHMTIEENGAIKNFDYDMTMRYEQTPSSVRYETGGYTLELDFYPHQRPQWGTIYMGKLFTREIGGYIRDMRCNYR